MKTEQIRKRQLDGLGVREIARELRVSPMTIRKVKQNVSLPNCGCGLPHGHKGWCSERLARSPKRQHYVTTVLPERNRTNPPKGYTRKAIDRANKSDAHVGIPKKADAATIAECREQPLHVRRFYQRCRLALVAATRLDRLVDEGATVIDIFLLDLIQPEPSPLQRLMQKEEHEEWEREHRRFWVWERSKPALAA